MSSRGWVKIAAVSEKEVEKTCQSLVTQMKRRSHCVQVERAKCKGQDSL